MKVIISYADGSKDFSPSDQKIIDYYSVSTYAKDELELDTFSDVFDLANEFGRTVEVGSFIYRNGKPMPHVVILNEEEEKNGMNVKVYLRGGNVIEISGITASEKSDLESGMNSRTDEHRIYVQSCVINGRAIDALDFFGTPDMEASE